MNREAIRANIASHVAAALPRNARQLRYCVYDEQPHINPLGIRVDPVPFEGTVVALIEDAFIVKTGRTDFAVVDRSLATTQPSLQDRVRVTPYCRRDFAGDRLDKPREETHTSGDGQTYTLRVVTLGGGHTRIPLPPPRCPYLADLIGQLESLPTPDRIRNIVHMMIDAGARAFDVVDPDDSDVITTPPEISFQVASALFSGRIAILYDRAMDLYIVEQRDGSRVVNRIGNVSSMELGAVLGELIDDGQWRRIRVEILMPGLPRRDADRASH